MNSLEGQKQEASELDEHFGTRGSQVLRHEGRTSGQGALDATAAAEETEPGEIDVGPAEVFSVAGDGGVADVAGGSATTEEAESGITDACPAGDVILVTVDAGTGDVAGGAGLVVSGAETRVVGGAPVHFVQTVTVEVTTVCVTVIEVLIIVTEPEVLVIVTGHEVVVV